MVPGGWIKIHRKMVGWEWYSNPTTFCVWMHLLIEANHEARMWHGKLIGVGQTITSLSSLSASTGLSVRQVRTALKNLQMTGNLTIQVTNKYSIITICKYVDYQIQEETKRQAKRQTKSQSNDNTIRNKEIEESYSIENNNKRNFEKPNEDEVRQYCEENGYKVDATQFISFYESKGWMVGRNKMKDWKAAVRTWSINNKNGNNYGRNIYKRNRQGNEVPQTPNYAERF